MIRRKCDYNKTCQLEFGEYCQVFDDTTNTMERRTSGAIALFPFGNEQGGTISLTFAQAGGLAEIFSTHYPC